MARLQRSMHRAALQNLQQWRLEAAEDEECKRETEAERKEKLKPINALSRRDSLMSLASGRMADENLVNYIVAANYNLTVEQVERLAGGKTAESNPFKPNGTDGKEATKGGAA